MTLIPYVGPWGEVKTKPTQHSVIKLREIGIQPDVLICRTKLDIDDDMKGKNQPLLRCGQRGRD